MFQPALPHQACSESRVNENSLALHVRVAVDGPTTPAWMADVVGELAAAPYTVSLTLLFVQPESAGASGSSPNHWLFQKYRAWDRRNLRLESNPLRPGNVLEPLVASNPSDRPQCSCEPDLLLWLSSQPVRAYSPSDYRYGIWIYRHGSQYGYAGEAEYFWELYNQDPTTVSALDVILPGKECLRVAESRSATEIGWSLERNRTAPYWKAARLVRTALQQFVVDKTNFLKTARPVRQIMPRQHLPKTSQILKFALRNAVRTAYRRLAFSHNEPSWFIAYRTQTDRFVAQTGRFEPSGFQKLSAPVGHFYADPFVQSWRGRKYLFFEDYVYSLGRGVISMAEFGEDGPVSNAKRILEQPYHLSYPFVFVDRDQLFMIPETFASKQIELYTAEDPSGPWRLDRVLMRSVAAADTTLWIEGGVYYLFTAIASHGITLNEELHLFYSDSLHGPWWPHPLNPVSSDVRSCRGAGKLFRWKNRLIRPAQDCSVTYGYACQLNWVERLTPLEYREQPLARIEPNWMPGLIGTHTLNSIPGLEVIDGQVLPPFDWLLHR
jgi:hypothetical protein